MNRREFLQGSAGAAGIVALGEVGSMSSTGGMFYEVSFLTDELEEIMRKENLRSIYTKRSVFAFRQVCRERGKKICGLDVSIIEAHREYEATLVCILAGFNKNSKTKFVVYYDSIKAGYYHRKRTFWDWPTSHEILLTDEIREGLIKEGCMA